MSTKEFEAMRFNILMAATSSEHGDFFPDEYVFAWNHGVYPIYNQNPLVEAFDKDFTITRAMMVELVAFLDGKWELGRGPGISFYELESHYGGRYGKGDWDRLHLINAVQYIYLHSKGGRRFDQKFFNKFLENAGAPSEANGFMERWDRQTDVYFC